MSKPRIVTNENGTRLHYLRELGWVTSWTTVPGAASKVKNQMHHKSRDSLLRGELYDEESGEWHVPPELADCVRVNEVRKLGSRKG